MVRETIFALDDALGVAAPTRALLGIRETLVDVGDVGDEVREQLREEVDGN